MIKWTRFFWLLFLIPSLMYARLHKPDCKDICKQADSEENRCTTFFEQYKTLGSHEGEARIQALNEAIDYCNRAITHYDTILNDIAQQSHKHRHKKWRPQMKKDCVDNKNRLIALLNDLKEALNNTFSSIAFEKAKVLHEEGERKAALANTKKQNCPPCHLNNMEAVVSFLHEVAHLYEEATLKERDALAILTSAPSPKEENKVALIQAIENYQAAAHKYRQEAADWPASVAAQKNSLKQIVATLNEDSELFIAKGLKRSAYELQKEAIVILEQLIESSSNQEADSFKEKIGELQVAVAAFENEADSTQLTEIAPLLSNEDFITREKKRKDFFFKNDWASHPQLLLQNILPTQSRPLALSLDGCIVKKDDDFTLYADQFYRFLIQSDAPVSELVVTVSKKGEIIHEEIILLPLENTPSWERYLTIDGMIFIPETKLKSDFGLDLRLHFVSDPRCHFSMMIAEKCSLPDYQFSFSLKDKVSLYTCNFLPPPPWQLDCLRKPAFENIDRPIDKKNFPLLPPLNNELGKQLENSFPILDQFVDQLKKDPLALAAYVHNEIELDHRLPYQEEGLFHTFGIQKNACMTFLEGRGSPWEQCQLLVYLLRKAGYPSLYVTGTTCSLPKTFLEKMLLTKLPSEQTEGLVNYPWVIVFDGKEWISLFPWMKEMQVYEGHDIYNLMPEEYASADRWILRYLKEDERILKHIDSDKDDTLGVLFNRFIQEELKKQGLSLSDVGIHQTVIKKQFSSWSDFSRPQITRGTPEILDILNKDSTLFAKAQVEIFSHENPQKKISHIFPLVDLNCNSIPLRFVTYGNNQERLHAQMIGEKQERLLDLDGSDQVIDIRVHHENFIGSVKAHSTKTISMEKGTEAALCFHLGGSSPKVTSQFYEQFSSEKEETKRLYALLSFVGAAYFEKCGRAEKFLASLHKISPVVDFAFGLTKMKGTGDLKTPQVDMMWFPSPLPSTFCQQESYAALRSLESLITVDASSNEHQILLDIFGVKEAVSTVKLFQLANRQQQKKGLPEPDFMPFNLQNGLISNRGPRSPLPSYYFSPSAINTWQLVPTLNSHTTGYTLHVPPSFNKSPSYPNFTSSPPLVAIEKSPFSSGTSQWQSDVRLEHKSLISRIGDPVDVVTGAFYIDEVDLSLPGPFAIEIRRNYNSQNPLIGDLGVGWKLSLNPSLIKQNGKLYAAEADGTIIAYSYNPNTSRWEVFPEENPDLYNFSSTSNPFHAYIENDTLYGPDGSKRIFEGGLLKKWINSRGNILEFSYSGDKLSRIESLNGNFCGLLYNHEGKISEIYAKDGRRISYNYNSQGDLVQVTLPNSSLITYEYDHSHRITRETKPHGKVLENIYKEGKVQELRSPMGSQQQMILSAKFDYQEGATTVTDAKGEKTLYKLFEKQIYKIIDPLGFETLESWFVDKDSWFDPIQEKLLSWNQSGGATRCLKSSTDKRGLTTFYLYDERGNPVQIGLQGKDLTGSGESLITKQFVYNDRDLCIQEELFRQKTTTTYDKLFPYLAQRIDTYSDNTLISYIDLEYNSQGLLEKEDNNGSITLWEYDSRGFTYQKIQLTGTDDPDVITTYSYNNEGQCVELRVADSSQQNSYDIMGNTTQSLTFSPSGALLSAMYIGYNLNNEPNWKQTANSQNTLHIDYQTSGLIKASRQSLSPTKAIAYTLYEYDPSGYLIEEVDPLGYSTYRDYDALGRMKSETREGHTTLFTYEPGGLIESITSPSGAKTTQLYTTNGLLKEEIYPDKTKSSIVYDFFGRPVLETKNDLPWEIKYDEINHRVIRTQLKTEATEISEFDARGNLIRFTDSAGYTSEKTYDGLNRLITETSPSGQQTIWNYQGDTVICSFPNGEQQIQRYEGGHVATSEVVNARGNLIASSSYHYDPETDIEQIIQGEEVTLTWMNALGLPIKVEKGHLITTYEYDRCGNCIAITDGDGRRTSQTFDGLRRITEKELPDGSLIGYAYDLDSHLSEYHLPNGTLWQTSYDRMGRKLVEELQVGRESSQRWEYTYEKGYLIEAKDPMQRLHTYHYEPNGRLAQERVDDWQRTYTYDPRGLLTRAEETRENNSSWLSSWVYGSQGERSLVDRSYDSDGRLILESIYLNSNLIQQTKQTWDASSRSLQIGDHRRDFIYQNNQLTQVSTGNINLAYHYDLSGSLKHKSTPFSIVVNDYNNSGLPENIHTSLPDGTYQESLTTYNLMGETLTHNQRQLEWDPWGRLLKVSDGAFTWEASYDALGRRLQTGYTPGWKSTLITTSLYDPEEEFQEIGVKYGDKTFWKMYGPNSCDAIIDESGASVILMHNALDQLAGVVSQQGTVYREEFPSAYGPSSSTPSIPSDLLSYAQSLDWRSKSQDPTGLIWLGARYYEPKGGRFLSPDPLGYPICLDLYAYPASGPAVKNKSKKGSKIN